MLKLKPLLSLLFLFPCLALDASGLPPEHEAVRLLLAVEELVEAEKWQQADVNLSRLSSLDVEQSEAFYFYQGQVFEALGKSADAMSSLEKYVVMAGSDGEHYRQALSLITRVERKSKEEPAVAAAERKAVPELQASDDGYIKSLLALYLTTNPVEALTQQINSLLSSHAFTGSRVKKNNGREGVRYSLAVSGHELLLQEKSFENGQPMLQMQKLNVLGVDPFIDYGCSNSAYQCFLYHPSKDNERWIQIDRDELVAGELSRAISKLMRLLQQSN